jgi:hypothetical protein
MAEALSQRVQSLFALIQQQLMQPFNVHENGSGMVVMHSSEHCIVPLPIARLMGGDVSMFARIVNHE